MPVLGLDTSCYTSSVALVNGRELLAEKRKLLVVPPGGRGLQQSNAFFQHVQNLPQLVEMLELGKCRIEAVAASARPRPAEGSYMPVFTAGQAFGRVIAKALDVPFFETSHQEGHIASGCFSLVWEPSGKFLAFHISGGTTELLLAKPAGAGFKIELIGGTSDLHAGQVVDRVGVALGLPFPAGPALEKLATECKAGTALPGVKANVSGANCSLSGVESAAQRHIVAGADRSAVAFAVQQCLAGAFIEMARHAAEQTGLRELLVIGGVASNEYIRSRMREELGKHGVSVLFAKNPYSSDNAVGVASIGQNFIYRGAE